MKLGTIVAVGLAALVVSTGAAVALPANAPDDAGPDGDVSAAQGPLGDLPEPVPDFVSGIHDTISSFLKGGLDGTLGPAVSENASSATPSAGSGG